MPQQNKYSKRDCIDAIKEAESILGRSPTTREYQSLNISGPSVGTIRRRFGWDELKKEIGLENNIHSVERDVPDHIDITKEKWESLSTKQQRRKCRKSWVAEIKINTGCSECGYSKTPAALSYHHTSDDKDISVAEMVARVSSKQRIKNEIDKCKLLCANCHRNKHSEVIP